MNKVGEPEKKQEDENIIAEEKKDNDSVPVVPLPPSTDNKNEVADDKGKVDDGAEKPSSSNEKDNKESDSKLPE